MEVRSKFPQRFEDKSQHIAISIIFIQFVVIIVFEDGESSDEIVDVLFGSPGIIRRSC
jgi:hypothetical protein